MIRYDKKEKRALTIYVFVFLLVALGIAIGGYFSYQQFEQQFRHQAENQVSAIAELKVNQLTQWRQERLIDAQSFYRNSVFSGLVEKYFEDPADVKTKEQLISHLEYYHSFAGYERLFLLDVNGNHKLDIPAALEESAQADAQLMTEAVASLDSKNIVFGDFQRDVNAGEEIYISILIPIFADQSDGRPLGALVLRIDPKTYLYPYINQWPLPSDTAETLLVRRDGEDVLFLNQIRFEQDAALTLRYPLTRTDIPAVKAVLGQTGLVEGVDYRGELVLADIRPVPDSPWFLVSKVDVNEVYVPLRDRLWQTQLIVGLAILLAGAGLALVWRQQRILVYRTKAEVTEALRESEEQFRTVYNNITIGLYRTTPDGHILMLNPPGIRMLGFDSFDEIEKLNLEQGRYTLDYSRNEFREKLESQGVIVGWESGWVKKDGSTIFVRESAKVFRDEDGKTLYYDGSFEDITERRLAEDALRQSEENLSTTLHSIGDGVISTDKNGAVVNMNPMAEKYCGWSLTDARGKPLTKVFNIINAETRKKVEDPVAKVIENGQIIGLANHTVLISKNGDEYQIADSAAPIKDKDGQIVGVVLVFSDVTEKYKATERLKESEANFADIFQTVSEGIAYTTLDGQVISINNSLERILEIPKEQIIGKNILNLAKDLLSTKNIKGVLPTLVSLVQGKEIQPLEIEYKNKIIEVAATINRDSGRLTGVVRDVTEHRQAKERLEQFFSVNLDLLCVADLEGNFIKVNKAWESILGYSTSEIEHRKFLEFVHPEDMDTTLATMATLGEQEQVINFVNRFRCMDGSYRFIEWRSQPFGNLIYAAARDITERKQAEDALRESEEKMSSIFRVAPTGIGVVRDRVLYEVNPRISEMTGYTKEELTGQSARILYPTQEEFEWVGKKKYEQIAKKGSGVVETHWQKKDGSIIDVLLASTPIDLADLSRGVTFTALDITERKQAEEAALQRNRQLEMLSRASQQINSVLEIPMILRQLVTAALELTSATDGTAGQIINHKMVFNEYNLAGELMPIDYQFVSGYGVPGWVMQIRAPYVSNDAEHDPHVIPEIQKALGFRNLVDVPILNRQGELLGCFEIHNKPGGFDDTDVLMLQGLASGAAIAWENAVMLVERKQAEEELGRQTALFRSLFERSPEAITIVDQKDHIVNVNRSFEVLFGYREEEIQGRYINDLIVSEQYKDEAEGITHVALEEGRVVEKETIRCTKDGRPVDVFMIGYPIIVDGRINGGSGIYRDITERKQAEQTLRDNQQLLQAVMDNIPQCIFWKDSQLTYLGCNRAFAANVGLASPNDIVGKTDWDLPSKYAEIYRADDNFVIKSGIPKLNYEEPQTTPNGVTSWLRTSKIPMRNMDGNVYAVLGLYEDITERKQAEEALKESEAIFSSFLEHSPVYVFFKDKDIRSLMLSKNYEQMLGMPISDLLGKTMDDLFPSDLAKSMVADDLRVLNEGRRITVEEEFNGHVYETTKFPVIKDGKPYILAGFTVDITARKQAEESLRESEERLRLAVSAGRMGAWDRNFLTGQLNWSVECKAMFGLPPEIEMNDERFTQVLHPEDRVPTDMAIREALEKQTDFDMEYRVIWPDGTTHWIAAQGRGYYDETGQAVHMAGITFDITERKQAEEALRESESRFRTLFEQAAVGVAQLDTNTGRFISINQKYCDILGYTQQEMLDLDFQTITHPDDLVTDLANMQKLIAGEISEFSMEKRYYRKDGGIVWVSLSVSPLWAVGELPNAHIAVVEDITARKQAEEALEKRMMALTAPLENTESITFNDLFNLKDIQQLQDDFAKATGVASIITQVDGTPITTPSNFCRLCNDVIRKNPKGYINCCKSDAALGRLNPKGPSIQPCMSGGLWDAGAGISVGGKHIANWLIGQVRDETQTEEKMLKYAEVIGVDKQILLEAFHEVPAMSRERFEQIANALFTLASQLSNMAYQNIQQARFIAERKQAEEALRESRALFRSLIESMPQNVFSKDMDGRFVFANQHYCATEGKTLAEIIGKTDFDLHPAHLAEQYWADDRRVIETKQVVEKEEVHQPLGGEISYVQVAKAPIYDADGQTKGMLGIFWDITDRKLTEEARRESEELYRKMNENSPLGMHFYKLDGEKLIFTGANPSADKLLGVENSQFIGKTIEEAFPPLGQTEVPQRYREAAANGIPWATEQIAYQDGRINGAFEVKAFQTTPGKMVAVFADITARKQAEEALKDSEERFKLLFQNLNSNFALHEIILDESGKPCDYRYLEINPAFEKSVGIKAADMIGKTAHELFPGTEAYWVEKFGEVALSGTPIEYENFSKELNKYYDMRIYSPQKGQFALIGMDVTARKLAEEEIHKLNAELEQRVRERTLQLETTNKELEAFSYSVSHDLRAPLRGIDGWSQALLEDYHDKLDEQGRQYIDRVRSDTQRMGRLIDDMLQLSRLTRAEMVIEEVDLSSLAQDIVERLKRDEPQRQVDFDIQAGVIAEGDAHLLEVVLGNLLGNAFKFTAKRADARIEFGQTEMEDQRVFFVRDNGAGFDMTYAQKLFGAFQRMHKASEFPGTGIGLATVQRIIHRHGGEVWAEAEVGRGATFYFTLDG